MIPIDSYDSMIYEINCRETNLVPTTVGVLLVDYDFPQAKEVIQPALKWLNEWAAETINFYLPGYKREDDRRNGKYFFENNNYDFHSDIYQEFCQKFFREFNLEPTFSPTLILFEYGNDSLSYAKKIVIDLSPKLTSISNIERLFKRIIQQAKKSPDLLGRSNKLQFNGLIKKTPVILDALKNLIDIVNSGKEIIQYCIK